MRSVLHIYVMAQSGRGRMLLDRCLANVKAPGVNAYLPGKGIFKADTWVVIECCLSKHYLFPSICHLDDLFFFSVHSLFFCSANVKQK